MRYSFASKILGASESVAQMGLKKLGALAAIVQLGHDLARAESQRRLQPRNCAGRRMDEEQDSGLSGSKKRSQLSLATCL
jgi:hypothetical protein